MRNQKVKPAIRPSLESSNQTLEGGMEKWREGGRKSRRVEGRERGRMGGREGGWVDKRRERETWKMEELKMTKI